MKTTAPSRAAALLPGLCARRVRAMGPVGYVALSGGVDHVVGREFLIVTALAPTFGETPVRFMGDALYAGGPSGYSAQIFNPYSSSALISVTATCAQLSSVLTIVNSAIVPSGLAVESSTKLKATCPSGYVALGGGAAGKSVSTRIVSSGPVFDAQTILSLPGVSNNVSPNGWGVGIANTGDAAEVKFGVVCTVGASVTTALGAISQVPSRDVTLSAPVACPAGSKAVAGGIESDDDTPMYLSTLSGYFATSPAAPSMRSDGNYAGLGGWSASVFNNGPQAQFIRIAVLCAASPLTPVIEFYNTTLRHYFRTANAAEAEGIDQGRAGAGWKRTDDNFLAYTAGANVSGTDICRFYTFGANSHFLYRRRTGVCRPEIFAYAGAKAPDHRQQIAATACLRMRARVLCSHRTLDRAPTAGSAPRMLRDTQDQRVPRLAPGSGTRSLPAILQTALFAAGCAATASAFPDAVPSLAPAKLAGITVPFTENAGQFDARVRFYAPTFGGTMYITGAGGLVLALPGKAGASAPAGTAGLQAPHPPHPPRYEPMPERGPGWTLVETFVGGRAAPVAGTRSLTNVSRFVGGTDTHRAALVSYEDVRLGEVYPGIDVRLRATGRNIEKVFTVQAGADPDRIKLRIDGADRMTAAPDGRLVLATGNGEVAYTPPVAFQETGGVRRAIDVAYALDETGNQYGFALGTYDRTQPLVIDPLLQSTYLGGTGEDRIYAMAVHPGSGEIIVAGFATSTNFPGTTGGAQPANLSDAGLYDGIVARLSPDLKTLLQATYLGGSGNEQIHAVAVHPVSGEVYVAGLTGSDVFPATAGGLQPTRLPNTNAFFSRLNASLTSVLQSTYFGSGISCGIHALAFDPTSGDVLGAGNCDSDGTIPGSSGAGFFCTGVAGRRDGIVTRISSDLTQVIQSTCAGFTSDASMLAIALSPLTNKILVAGQESATEGTVFIFGADLKTFWNFYPYSGLQFTSMVVNPVNDEILLAGYATGAGLGSGSNGGAQSSHAAGTDGFVMRWAQNFSFLQATYLGGGGDDYIGAMAIHPSNGDLYVTGYTKSTDLPGRLGGLQSSRGDIGNHWDVFVSALSSDLTKIRQSTYLGGTGEDVPFSVAINPANGEVLVAGYTTSSDLPGAAAGAQPTLGGAGSLDGFIARLTPDLTLNDSTPNAYSFAAQANVPLYSVRTSGPVQITGITGQAAISVEGRIGSTYCVSSTPDCSCDISVGFKSAPSSLAAGSHVCVRHTSAGGVNQLTRTDVHIGGALASFIVTTGTLIGGNCTLDVDGNGAINALTDGLMLLRAMFGLTGTAVTSGAVGPSPARADWASIRAYLNGNCGTGFAP